MKNKKNSERICIKVHFVNMTKITAVSNMNLSQSKIFLSHLSQNATVPGKWRENAENIVIFGKRN